MGNRCEDRIDEALASRLDDLEKLHRRWMAGDDSWDDELGRLYEYGLAFDYVEPGTFEDQDEGYWRYQISWGGPSDEFRFYLSPGATDPYRIEYWFLDWFDGASRDVTDVETARDVWAAFEPTWDGYDYEAA